MVEIPTCHFFVVENIQKRQFFGNIDLSMNSGPRWRGITRDIKKIIYIFKTQQNMVTKLDNLQSWNPSLHFSILNCPNLITIFCQVLKMKIIIFDIPINPAPIAVWNSLTNQFYQRNWCFFIFSKKVKTEV